MLRRGTVFAALFAPLIAAAEPPRADGCEYVPPAESVGRLLDSLTSLLRALPQPRKSEIDVARERVSALAPETGRNAHLLSREISEGFSHFQPVEIFSRRNEIASRLRVDVSIDDTALLVLIETGMIPPSQTSPSDLGDKVTRGSLKWADPALPPLATNGAVIRLRPDRTSDRTIITDGRGSRYDWRGAAFLVQHRPIAPPNPVRPDALVLGPLNASDVEAIALPSGEAWDARAAKIKARHPNVKLTRTP